MKSIIQNNKVPLIASVGVYFSGIAVAVLLFFIFDSSTSTYGIVLDQLQTGQTDLTTVSLIRNNERVILNLISGAFFLGSTTFLNLVLNGLILGVALIGSMKSATITTTLLLLLPHAIFEVPAAWIAGAAGFKIPYELILYLFNKKNYVLNKVEIVDFFTLFFIAIVLTIIAAFIEANITLKIAGIIQMH
jgi:Uncharacterized membrane protein